jgi:phosphatidylglycerol lysyltransferase
MVPLRARFWIQLVAVLVVMMGAVNVLSALLAHAPHRLQLLHSILPFQVTRGSRTLTVAVGFLLMLLGKGLWRRKRRAWEFAVLLLGVSLVLHLVKGLDYEEGLGILALILGLVHLRPYYTAKSDPPSARQGLVVLAGALAFTLLYGIVGFRLLRHQFTGIQDLHDALSATLLYFFELGNRHVHPLSHRARWFLDSIYTVAMLSIGYAVLMLSRPAVLRERPEPEDRDEVERLLREHARTGLAHFARLPDKAYFFNERRTGVVAYKLVGNIALALGDPIAPREEVPALIGAFSDFCSEHDWHPAFYQVVPDFLGAYQRQGLDVLKIGEDANIHLPEFRITGKKMGGIRHAVNAAERAGIRAERYDLARDERNLYAQLKDVSDLWLAEHKGSEKTFSLGYFDREWISRCPMMIALDAQDRVVAFETLIPMYRANGMAGDLMRRRPDAPKGTMDLVMVRQAQRLQEDGYEWYGQGLSPLSTGEVQDAYRSRILDRAVRLFYNYFNFFYGFKGLHAFKDKYRPVWESRYLVYPGSALLLKTVAAIIRADSTEGLLAFLLKRRANPTPESRDRREQYGGEEKGERASPPGGPGGSAEESRPGPTKDLETTPLESSL